MLDLFVWDGVVELVPERPCTVAERIAEGSISAECVNDECGEAQQARQDPPATEKVATASQRVQSGMFCHVLCGRHDQMERAKGEAPPIASSCGNASFCRAVDPRLWQVLQVLAHGLIPSEPAHGRAPRSDTIPALTKKVKNAIIA